MVNNTWFFKVIFSLTTWVLLMGLTVEAFPPGIPDDPMYPEQTNLHRIGIDVEGAWITTIGHPGVVIAILDSGLNYTHEDLVKQVYLNQGEVVHEPVTDANGNSVIDRHDLFLLGVGNNVDDDGNGYVDDFSGWDFDDDDNNEADATSYGHGTGRAGIAAAEADNSLGIAGVAPGCKLMGVRIGDTFIVSPEKLARGVVFAVDAGAKVIEMALGSLGNSQSVRQAFQYAHENGLVAVSSSANEGSYHHNQPTIIDDVIAVGAIVPDSIDGPWKLTANYSNYGAHLLVVAPTSTLTTKEGGGYGTGGGTSSAAPHAAGVAALVISRAMELNEDLDPTNDIVPFLTADEVKQILIMTATDLVGTRLNMATGWDRYSGYGKLNAKAAVEMVSRDTIPPEVDINSPDWYTMLYKDKTPVVPVEGIVKAPRASSLTYELEYGIGVEPTSWITLVTGTTAVTGKITDWDISGILENTAVPETDPGRFAVTLRLKAIDNLGNYGEDRMTVFVKQTDGYHTPGFPMRIPNSGEAPPVLVDLNGDNRMEIILADSDGYVSAYQLDGTQLPGWPVRSGDPGIHWGSKGYKTSKVVPGGAAFISHVAVADMDHDHLQEIVASCMDGKVYAWKADGSPMPGFPVNSANYDEFFGAPSLYDIDNDGDLEIFAACFDQQVYAWHHDGTPLPGWPVLARDTSHPFPQVKKIVSTPALGDINGDSFGEIVVTTNESYKGTLLNYGRAYAFDRFGNLLPGWPVGGETTSALFQYAGELLPIIGEGIPNSPLIADLDGNSTGEIIISTLMGYTWVFSYDGSIYNVMLMTPFGALSDATQPDSLWGISTGSIADFDSDSDLDFLGSVLVADLANLPADDEPMGLEFCLGAWDLDSGSYLEHFPHRIEDYQFFQNPMIADIDGIETTPGIRDPEMITGSGGYFLNGMNYMAVDSPGWPKFTGGWILGSPAVADIDADRKLEVVAVTRERYLFIFQTDGPSGYLGNHTASWWSAYHDDWNSLNIYNDSRRPAAIENLRVSSSGGTTTLTWTAVGDDDFVGTTQGYEIKYASVPITDYNYLSAKVVPNTLVPKTSGAPESFSFPVIPGASYFAVKAYDDQDNYGAIYNPGSSSKVPIPDFVIVIMGLTMGIVVWHSFKQTFYFKF